jgi:hypothetical protein
MRLPTAVSLLSSPKRAWLLLVMLSVYTARGAHALHFPRNATAHHLGDSDRSRSKGWRCELASNASGSIRPLRRAPKLSFVKFCGPSELQFEQRLRDLPSRSEELHLEPLTEPYVSLSTYTARATHRRLPPSAAINELLPAVPRHHRPSPSEDGVGFPRLSCERLLAGSCFEDADIP